MPLKCFRIMRETRFMGAMTSHQPLISLVVFVIHNADQRFHVTRLLCKIHTVHLYSAFGGGKLSFSCRSLARDTRVAGSLESSNEL
jgi:hypothetical protein